MKLQEDIEAIVIGLALANPDAISRFDVRADEFEKVEFRGVWNAIRSMLSEGLVPDVMSVSDRSSGIIDLAELVDLYRESRSVSNLDHYLEIFHKVARGRETRSLALAAATAIDEHKDPDKVRGRLLTKLSESASNSKTCAVSVNDILLDVTDYLDEMHTARHENRTIGVPTGIYWLDRDTGGLHPSNLIVIGARPAMGKTALGLTIALNAAMRGKRIGIISTEMSKVELGLRLVSMISGVSGKSLRDSDLTETDFQSITKASLVLKDFPIFVVDIPACRISDVVIHTRAMMLSGGIDVLIVDHLQRLISDEKSENRNREVGKAASAMKNIARQNKIPVVALSQINRGIANRQDKRPTMADLRDSGEIEAEADMVLLLHRPSEYDPNADQDEAEIIIDKNRHGPTALIPCTFRKEIMRWMNKSASAVNGYSEEEF